MMAGRSPIRAADKYCDPSFHNPTRQFRDQNGWQPTLAIWNRRLSINRRGYPTPLLLLKKLKTQQTKNLNVENPVNDVGYHLIDFGGGRKLESFAGRIVDRPSPAAEGMPRAIPGEWSTADSYFEVNAKTWQHRTAWPSEWAVDCLRAANSTAANSTVTNLTDTSSTVEACGFRMPVQPTPYGHVGLFPEQHANWRWLQSIDASFDKTDEAPLKALNLFGYTGASSMALASVGFQVAHVDAAKPNVQSARDAAKINGLQDAPIRYLVDDAMKFAAREARRENRYHTIVLDPPAYGHSPKGKAWRLERDLWVLLELCLKIVTPESFRILVTGHSPQIESDEIANFFFRTLPQKLSIPAAGLRIDKGRSQLTDRSGRKLDAGFYVRCSR